MLRRTALRAEAPIHILAPLSTDTGAHHADPDTSHTLVLVPMLSTFVVKYPTSVLLAVRPDLAGQPEVWR